MSSTGDAMSHPRLRGKRKQGSICQNSLRSREKSGQPETGLPLSMAKQKKKKLSLTSDMDVDTDRTSEVEVSYGGEADLQKHLNSCKKNPGHQNFVPVDQFSIEHLPSDYRNNELLDLIRAMSDLTVRLSVKCVSDQGPETSPDSNDPKLLGNGSHRSVMRTGTGWVYGIEKNTSQSRCSRCKGSSSSNIKHVMVCIQTAAHVVYDQEEAQHTTCYFFFDKGNKPDLCPGGVALAGAFSIDSDKKRDWCLIWYVTCDFELIDRLEKKLELARSLVDKAYLWLGKRLRERESVSLHILWMTPKNCCVL